MGPDLKSLDCPGKCFSFFAVQGVQQLFFVLLGQWHDFSQHLGTAVAVMKSSILRRSSWSVFLAADLSYQVFNCAANGDFVHRSAFDDFAGGQAGIAAEHSQYPPFRDADIVFVPITLSDAVAHGIGQQGQAIGQKVSSSKTKGPAVPAGLGWWQFMGILVCN